MNAPSDPHPDEAGETRPGSEPPTDQERPPPPRGPYPAAMHYQLLTPRAPLVPGAGVRGYLNVHPQPASPPQWATDPFGRHELRWWGGSHWSEHVADDGVASTDPPG